MNKETIVRFILDGEADSFIPAIKEAISMRKEILNDEKMLFLSAGDIVRFNRSTRPKYLQGLRATVVKPNQKTITVRILEEDKISARKYGWGEFRTPLGLVDKVD